MYLRNNLLYNNITYFLMYVRLLMGQLADYLEETFGFMKDYEARDLMPQSSSSHRKATLKLYDKMKKINEIIRRKNMNFLEATLKAQNGQKMRRKEWLPGGSNAWIGKKVYVWWDAKYKCLLAAGPYVPQGGQPKFKDTEGYTYVCEGTDIEAKDWEKANVC